MKFKVCLHLDINKTLILQDGSSGRGLEKSLHSLLSECVWGQYPLHKTKSERTLQDWQPISSVPCTSVPDETVFRLQAAEQEAFSTPVTLGSYVEDHMVLPKAQQRNVKTTFATEDNPIGSRFYQYFQQLSDKMTLSDSQKQRVAEVGDMSYLSSGFFHVLPSVFQLLDYISTLPRDQFDIRLVFRSFGTDIFQVADEINRYCEGRHPLFKPTVLLDGSNNSYDFRLKFPHCSGCFLRTGHEPKDIHLSFVDAEQLVSRKSGAKAIFDHIFVDWLALVKPSDEDDLHATRNQQHSVNTHVHAIAIRDDYAYWHSQHESDVSGKLLLVDRRQVLGIAPTDGEDYVIQLFLDDNIERDRPHIIDVRRIDTFESIPFEQSNQRLIRRVEPWDAVMDCQYFVNILQDLLARLQH